MRQAGILIPLASLPGENGCGDFGSVSYEWIDQLAMGGIHLWQLLPLNKMGYGNSPYQPFSSYAMDEIYLDLADLYHQKLLTRLPKTKTTSTRKIDYQAVRKLKMSYGKKAWAAFTPDSDYKDFISQPWVRPYAQFIGLKHLNHEKTWTAWKGTDPSLISENEIGYEMFMQYQLVKQWLKLKDYANSKGIQIIGDLPFYVGLDSADVYYHRSCFQLNKDGNPAMIAGVPPDYFSPTGQRWGNPLYDWEWLQKNNFSFLIDRLGYAGKMYDVVRLDHFRAFDTYWQIPATCPTAQIGSWQTAPGYEFFDTLLKRYPNIHLVAENLGQLRPQVQTLCDHYHLMGMLVAQFCIDPLAIVSPDSYAQHLIFYTGTHDNEPSAGWISTLTQNQADKLTAYLVPQFGSDPVSGLVNYVLQSKADWAIIPVADIMGLGHTGRINTPGTVGGTNWQWKLASYASLKRKLKAFFKQVKAAQR